MSYDLCFWRVDQPITSARALETYRHLLGDSEADIEVRADERVANFHTELMEMFPPLETLDDQAAAGSPWSMTPECALETVITTMKWSHVATAPVLIGLAGDHGVVCFDPQTDRVHHPPDIMDVDGAQLVFCDGGAVNDPAPADLRSLLQGLSARNWYAYLERESDGFVQVGLGEHAGGLADDEFALEYRAPTASRLRRTVTSDFDQVVELFETFAEMSGDLTAMFDWELGFTLR